MTYTARKGNPNRGIPWLKFYPKNLSFCRVPLKSVCSTKARTSEVQYTYGIDTYGIHTV